MAGRVLWVSDTPSVSDGIKLMLGKTAAACGIPASALVYSSVHQKASAESETPEKSHYLAELRKYIQISKASLVALACPHTLVKGFMPELARLKAPLAAARGSLLKLDGVPIIVVDKPNSQFASPKGRWLHQQDISKLGRWFTGKQRKQPRFEYTVCRNIHDLKQARDWLSGCLVISEDIETHGGQITCIGFSGLDGSGRVHTYVIPLWNPLGTSGRMFEETLEVYAWECIAAINSSPARKVMHNGAYDSSYLIQYGVPADNYSLDTLHMWHSIYTEAPKKLDVVSSVLLDFYRYWKEENKGTKEEKAGKFKTWESMEKYWRYNALDCYYTLLNSRVLCAILNNLGWATSNYAVEFPLQIGPCLAMSMRGMAVDEPRLNTKMRRLEKLADDNLATLRIMAADPEFNPASPQQYAHVLFRILGAKMPALRGKAAQIQASKKSPYSTDEKVLKLVQQQHPLLEMFIKRVLAAKQPRNMCGKYKPEKILHPKTRRFMYSLSAAGTETGRLSGKKSHFWVGTNPQNVPGSVRDFAVPDPGYVFFEPDFSQSDAMFVAYESQDPQFIANMTSGKDTHCLHAAHFFRPRTYEEINAGNKAKDPFYADEVTGIRAITKKIVHGKNYNMGGYTLYMLMGRTAAVAAAVAKGYNDAGRWDEKRVVNFCQSLLDDYDKMYPGLSRWKTALLALGKKNGGRLTVAGGRTRQFFGDLLTDAAAQREAIAYFGQGGTAGNTNRTMLDLYFRDRIEDGYNCMFLSQTHDSLLFQIREEVFHEYAQRILTCMEKPLTIHGREMYVRADGKCGYAWGRGLIKYTPEVTLAQMWEAHNEIVLAHTEAVTSYDFRDIEEAEWEEAEEEEE